MRLVLRAIWLVLPAMWLVLPALVVMVVVTCLATPPMFAYTQFAACAAEAAVMRSLWLQSVLCLGSSSAATVPSLSAAVLQDMNW